MNSFTLKQCIVGAYVKYIKRSKINKIDIKTDKHKIYRIENVTLSTKKKDKTVIYALEEINTKNMRFITTQQLRKHFLLDTTANLLLKK